MFLVGQHGRWLVSIHPVGHGDDVRCPVGHPLFTLWSSAFLLADLIASKSLQQNPFSFCPPT